MKHKDCENEVRILESLAQGVAPEAMEEPLRTHLASCSSCAEMISVYQLFQTDSQQLCALAPLPDAGRVWWRATLAARQAAANRALRPILIAERIALAIGGGALIAALILAGPWVAEQVRHFKIFTGTVVYSLSLSSLIVSSMIVSLLLMAGALYALWADK